MDVNDTTKKNVNQTFDVRPKKARHGQKTLYVEQKNDNDSRGEFFGKSESLKSIGCYTYN